MHSGRVFREGDELASTLLARVSYVGRARRIHTAIFHRCELCVALPDAEIEEHAACFGRSVRRVHARACRVQVEPHPAFAPAPRIEVTICGNHPRLFGHVLTSTPIQVLVPIHAPVALELTMHATPNGNK